MHIRHFVARIAVMVLAAATLAACSTSRPMTLGAVQPMQVMQTNGSAAPAVTVLQRNVSATDCPNPGDMYGDYNDAVQAANALANVRFAVKDTVGHYCLRVTGDAVTQ
jgi:hypothetical protein